ncbi:MAG TPA: ATP-binding protein [Longimicrobiaceae bacterium]|nr:ATP-binding protein [Longimicrobiaceae bacterium]
MPALFDLLGASSYRLSPNSVPSLVTTAAMLALGLVVVVRERASRESLGFGLIALTVVGWQFCFGLMYASARTDVALWWARSAYLGISLIPPAIYDFTVHVLRAADRRRPVAWLCWAAGLGFAVAIVPGNALLVGLYHYPWGVYPHFGWFGVPYLLYFALVLVLSLREYAIELRATEPGPSRSRTLRLLASFMIAYFAVADYAPAFGIRLYPAGYIFVLVFLGLTAWTIGRYRLVDLTASFAAEQILATTADLLIVVDAGGLIRIANGATGAVLGFAEGALIGAPVETLAPPGAGARLREVLDRPVVRDEEQQLRRRTGELVDVSVSASHLLGADDRSVGVVIVARDIRDRKRAERALREREEELRQAQKMEAIGRLAGGVAHDFNNLLTVISGQAQLLRDEPGDADEALTSLEEILQAADRASGLTRQLLAFSRRQVLEPRVLELNAVVSGVERMLRRLIGEDVQLSVSLAPEAGRVEADPGQLEQVLMNLSVNARDAMPGGGTLTLTTAAAVVGDGADGLAPGRYAVLHVRDTGGGMTPETISHIFEPFFTTKEQGKGTGLGLSTVYGIVKQSGGAVRVDSELGRGTTFEVFLPQCDAPLPGVDARDWVGGPQSGTETVLLAEDDQAVRTLARQILTRRGYRVIEASDGWEAIRLCDAHPGRVDLLLTDVVMPGLGGRELAERLRRRRPELAVLYMSGYPDEELARHGLHERGVALLQKPFGPTALADRVREMLAPGVRSGATAR